MSLLISAMHFLKIPNRLCRTDYLIIVTFMFFSAILVLILTVAISDIVGTRNNTFFYVFLLFIWVAKLMCSIARLHDVDISGWWIIPFLLFSPIYEIIPITLFNVVIHGLLWITPFFISEIVLIMLPGTKGQNRFMESSKIETPITNLSEPKVKGWNWGPFILTFFWTIFHGFWGMAILSIIPGIGFLIGIILGFKGNEWAWKIDKHKNYHIFIEQQRRWNKVGIIFIIMYSVIFIPTFSFFGYTIYDIKYGKTYTKISHTINNTEKLTDLLGHPIQINSFFNFNIKNNFARYEFDVVGPKNRGRIVLKQYKGETIYLVLMLHSKEKVVIVDEILGKHLKNLDEEVENKN